MPHVFRTRVYYEDTDLAGIVYYANYLKFIERARTEWVGSLGVDQVALKAERGIVFAVRRVEADYLRRRSSPTSWWWRQACSRWAGRGSCWSRWSRAGASVCSRRGDAGLPDRGWPRGAVAAEVRAKLSGPLH